jgi:hypothetical protein
MRNVLAFQLHRISLDQSETIGDPPRANHYNLQVANLEEIPKRQTGQIILKAIHNSGSVVKVSPYMGDHGLCNARDDGCVFYSGALNWHRLVGFSPDPSCHMDPQSHDYESGGSPPEVLFHELAHAFRWVSGKRSGRRQSVYRPALRGAIGTLLIRPDDTGQFQDTTHPTSRGFHCKASDGNWIVNRGNI